MPRDHRSPRVRRRSFLKGATLAGAAALTPVAAARPAPPAARPSSPPMRSRFAMPVRGQDTPPPGDAAIPTD
jgi:hypothetical protein